MRSTNAPASARPSLSPMAALLVALAICSACSSDGGGSGGVTNAELQEACANGVAQCKNDPTYGLVYGSQQCDAASIEAAYAGCDEACRTNAQPIIDCQVIAADCAAFAACAQ